MMTLLYVTNLVVTNAVPREAEDDGMLSAWNWQPVHGLTVCCLVQRVNRDGVAVLPQGDDVEWDMGCGTSEVALDELLPHHDVAHVVRHA